MSRQILSRNDRVAQMTAQEELIAKKRQEILEKQKTLELGKAVAAAQSENQNGNKSKETSSSESSTPVTAPKISLGAGKVPPEIQAKFQNSFCNDGSFLAHFKKILEQNKKRKELEVEKVEETATSNESSTADIIAVDTQANQHSITHPDLSQPPPQIIISQQPPPGHTPILSQSTFVETHSSSPVPSASPEATAVGHSQPVSVATSDSALSSSADPISSEASPSCEPSIANVNSQIGSAPATVGPQQEVIDPQLQGELSSPTPGNSLASNSSSAQSNSLVPINAPPPLISGSSPPMAGPPPSLTAPPPSRTGPPPPLTGHPPTTGPPPRMLGPPPSMVGPKSHAGPPPLMAGPPSISGAQSSMAGPPAVSRPPPTAARPPPHMTCPPPTMQGSHIPISPFQSIPQPMPTMSHFGAPPNRAFYNPCIPNLRAFTSMTTPPPPPPPSTPLYLIPPPDPLQLNKIPPPKDLDLNAIPKPEMNVERIRIPHEFEQLPQASTQMHGHREQQPVFSDSNEFLPTTLESLVELVAEKGDAYEDRIRSRKNDVHSSLWFIFDVDSLPYKNYRSMVESLRRSRCSKTGADNYCEKPESNDEKYDPESVIESHDDSDDEYMRDIMDKNLNNLKRKIEESKVDSEDCSGDEERREKIRKRKSRWGGKANMAETAITAITQTTFANQNKPLLSVIQRTDPALLQYARQNYGTIDLSEEDWRKCEDHFKINLLYQDMMRKRKEIDQLAKSGKFKYEYDSDEDTTGGTWEHKLRCAEMEATQAWADALTAQSEGKHHIGDFLPPEELKKFMEKYDAKKNNRTPDLSDYKEYKLREDNIGFQMLQKLGWKEGQGLGASGSGIVDPVNKAPQRDANQGLGAGTPSTPEDCDNEYEAYRKRMMLAYRFRPNPLNNPRRAYY